MGGILIIGAGGHAKVVADILLQNGTAVSGYLDDNPATWSTRPLGLPVLGPISSWAAHAPDGLVLGVGSNAVRRRLVAGLRATAEDLWQTAIHPSAIVAPSATIGRGVVVAAGAIVNPDTAIGQHAIINTGASVDHDCEVGPFTHIAPGARIAGGVRVGTGTLLGIGACVIPGRTIGAWATVGAGAVVIDDLPDHCTAVGVPATVIRQASSG